MPESKQQILCSLAWRPSVLKAGCFERPTTACRNGHKEHLCTGCCVPISPGAAVHRRLLFVGGTTPQMDVHISGEDFAATLPPLTILPRVLSA